MTNQHQHPDTVNRFEEGQLTLAQTFSIEFNGFGWQTVYPERWSDYSATFTTVEHAAADLLQVVGEIGDAANKPQQGGDEEIEE